VIGAMFFAWKVGALVMGAVTACIVVHHLAEQAKQRRTENRILAAEAQDASDLATCQRIASLPAREPRRTP
jgi:hypothetical protein